MAWTAPIRIVVGAVAFGCYAVLVAALAVLGALTKEGTDE